MKRKLIYRLHPSIGSCHSKFSGSRRNLSTPYTLPHSVHPSLTRVSFPFVSRYVPEDGVKERSERTQDGG